MKGYIGHSIKWEPQRIVLNGCGEEYTYEPADENSGLMEWIEYVPQPQWLSGPGSTL